MPTDLIEVRMADFPECWDSCGTCRSDDLLVAEVLVAPGDRVALYSPLLVLEAVKTEMEVTAPCAGRIEQILVAAGDEVGETELLLLLAPDG